MIVKNSVKPYLYFVLSVFLLITHGVSALLDVSLDVEIKPLDFTARICSGAFITHALDHTTSVPGGDEVRMFEANGSGVGVNDLDGDHDLDIVLANHAGENTILWNEGHLKFRTERMTQGDSRAVTVLDIDADGQLDLVFTRRASAPNYWHNIGGGVFEQVLLRGVGKPLYAIDWADFDADGDLDLAGGTYDAGLLNDLGQEFLASGAGGVYYYENQAGRFGLTRISDHAQALALVALDLDRDNLPEILVGNDFTVPDQYWQLTPEGWRAWEGFRATTRSTMGFDYGDINNDGETTLFATDMKPYDDSLSTRNAWGPIIRSIREDPPRQGDPQIPENILQIQGSDGAFLNRAHSWGIEATGWSWSGKFGDLDQDGFLDLYVVNGMIEATTFAHLPQHELVEQNQAFRNNAHGFFERMPDWGLGSSASGRGMSMADLDNDGDLDIVVNNLRTPSQVFENQLCQGSSLQVDLLWRGSPNTRAVGATLILHTSMGDLRRNVRVSSGYLSSDPARIHFGFPQDALLHSLEIQWPDGSISQISDVPRDIVLEITR